MDTDLTDITHQGYYIVERGTPERRQRQHVSQQHLQQHPQQLQPYPLPLTTQPPDPPPPPQHLPFGVDVSVPRLRGREDYVLGVSGQQGIHPIYHDPVASNSSNAGIPPSSQPFNYSSAGSYLPHASGQEARLSIQSVASQIRAVEGGTHSGFSRLDQSGSNQSSQANQSSHSTSDQSSISTSNQLSISTSNQSNQSASNQFSLPTSNQPSESTSHDGVPSEILTNFSKTSTSSSVVVPSRASQLIFPISSETAKGDEKTESTLPEFLGFRFAPCKEGGLTGMEEGDIIGVEAKERVEKGVLLGPYDGNLLAEQNGVSKDSSWELCLHGKVFQYIDGSEKYRPHMMSYIQCARTKREQNLEAIQTFGDIYFRVTEDIEPGTELRVFYSDVYLECSGFTMGLSDLNYREDKDQFGCVQCGRCLSCPKLMLRHIKAEHDTPKSTDLFPVVVWKMKGKSCEHDNVHASGSSENVKMSHSKKKRSSVQGSDKKKYICVVCDKGFSSQGRLKAHSMFHGSAEDEICPVRGDKQKNRNMLVKHKQLSHKCAKCDKTYKSKGALRKHERDVHGILVVRVVRKHKCQFCPTEFTRKKECKMHEKTHEEFSSKRGNALETHSKLIQMQSTGTSQESVEENERIAGDADMTQTQTKSYPNYHPNYHRRKGSRGKAALEPQDMLGKAADYYLVPRPYKCRHCPQRYMDKRKVVSHEQEVHEGKGKYKCAECSKLFMKKGDFLNHVKTHEQHRFFRCSLCPRSFASEKALNNHQGEHSGLKPFKCELCGRAFRTKKFLYDHKKRMHEERKMRFFCSFCNKGFPDKTGLKLHESRHKGIRPFVCRECGKSFTSKYSLQLHVKNLHEHERPHTCPICGQSFALNHRFTAHMFRHKLQGQTQPPDADLQSTREST